jgi:RNA polymerase sigma factor (sigma-70 family)
MKQAFSSQDINNAFGFERHLDIPSLGLGAGTAQDFLRAYESSATAVLGAFNSNLLPEIGKIAVGFASVAQQFGEWVERWSRPLAETFERLRREMDQWPMDPYGEPVPVHNARLYRLAIAAYEGNPVAQARFLNEIEAGDFLGDVSLVDDLLKPTFDPERPDRRKDWWLMEAAEARCWLRKRLSDIRMKKDSEREAAERIYAQREETELLQVQGKRIIRATARDMLDFDPDLIEFERQERETLLRHRIQEMLTEILPERQHQIFWCLAHEMPHKQIAHRLGLSEGAIKAHAYRMRNNIRANPELLQVLRLNGTLG